MKQLLHRDESTENVVVALNDRAFFGSLKENLLIELLPSQQAPSSNGKNDHNEDDESDVDEDEVVETKQQNENNIDNNVDEKDSTNMNEINEKSDEKEMEVSKDHEESNSSKQKFAHKIENINPLEIQAVATFSLLDMAWCAVSRHDKSLSIYCINKKTTINEDGENYSKLLPTTIHKSSKRVGSLCFAIVPPPSKENKESDEISEALPVIIAGDLAGDAIAYSLTNSKENEIQNNETAENELIEHDHKVSSKYKRLLLGHTASMITSVHVVQTEITDIDGDVNKITKKQHIITSDRDEKIRISCFPATHKIEGFLLGHESFISCVDYSEKTNRCVSISGDKTIRLWDYTTYEELAVAFWDVSDNKESNPPNNTVKDENDENNVEVNNEQLYQTASPSRVAMNSFGDIVASIYEDCKRIDLWKVYQTNDGMSDSQKSVDTKGELRLCLQHEIMEQPLAVTFIGYSTILVLTRNPEFLCVYTVKHESDGGLSIVNSTSEYAICKEIKKIGQDEKIIMPEALLERDSHNQKIKLQKLNEQRGGSRTIPWNNFGRKETAKERIRRVRKRKRNNNK